MHVPPSFAPWMLCPVHKEPYAFVPYETYEYFYDARPLQSYSVKISNGNIFEVNAGSIEKRMCMTTALACQSCDLVQTPINDLNHAANRLQILCRRQQLRTISTSLRVAIHTFMDQKDPRMHRNLEVVAHYDTDDKMCNIRQNEQGLEVHNRLNWQMFFDDEPLMKTQGLTLEEQIAEFEQYLPLEHAIETFHHWIPGDQFLLPCDLRQYRLSRPQDAKPIHTFVSLDTNW